MSLSVIPITIMDSVVRQFERTGENMAEEKEEVVDKKAEENKEKKKRQSRRKHSMQQRAMNLKKKAAASKVAGIFCFPSDHSCMVCNYCPSD